MGKCLWSQGWEIKYWMGRGNQIESEPQYAKNACTMKNVGHVFCGLGNMLWFLSFFFCVANKAFFSQLSIVWCFVDELQPTREGPYLSGCCNCSFKRPQVLFPQQWRIEDNQKPQSIDSVIVYASELNYQKLLPAEFENPLLWCHRVSHSYSNLHS